MLDEINGFQISIYNLCKRLSQILKRDVDYKKWYPSDFTKIGYIIRIYDKDGKNVEERYALILYYENNKLYVKTLKILD
ncbi:hypothetical protein [Sulfolobus ellipsoid virus 1]|uniref:Uncharacterized protein n=1 Tax=Sulfolobus ellipsoid virus 1 TaxID=2056194 RepID=A0A2H4RBM6_9VIRU|nr:hypothetical protein FGG62_gp05 [Sulfolobus ellipsoid virus 1]ATY46483.1 hypothetical protein [Sulfolobus ellipsoid virus 1]